ncbi:response regulator [Allosphingosinicella indica]|uniref:Response regulator receiver domain-containing protein n=1 Tax=Allosphingosinicella indica TaxID=941907 RepID=A0A1X7H397_9SPHN|nr:response regulator [Allosphingosinicella indica]SMF78822.1 Response regulator receiver domain-containing protein [Allosphingosinicella indica]
MYEPRSILIVEDEPLIAMMLEDFLDSLGHRIVGTVDSVEEALDRVAQGGFDVAIVDVQLRGGEKVWPVADKLAETGVPFVLATGGHVDPPPAEHAAVPVLAKPYTIDAIQPAIEAAIAG